MGSKITLGLGALVTMELDAVKLVSTRSLREKMRTACGALLDGKDGRPEVLEDGKPRICGTQPKSSVRVASAGAGASDGPGLQCPTCGTGYSHYGAVPYRAYDAGGVEVFIPLDEIDAAIDAAKEQGEQNVVRFIPLDEIEGAVVRSGEPDAYLPRKDAPPPVLQQYRLILLALAHKRVAMLTRVRIRGSRVKSMLVTADAKRNILVAYEARMAEPLPRNPPVFEPAPALLAQAEALIDALTVKDVAFVPEPDPLEPLIEARLGNPLDAMAKTLAMAEDAAKRKAEKKLGVAIEESAPVPPPQGA